MYGKSLKFSRQQIQFEIYGDNDVLSQYFLPVKHKMNMAKVRDSS